MIRALREAARVLRRIRGRPIVLMYHRIADADCDPWDLAVSPARFDEQLAMLKRDREVFSLVTFGRLLATRRLPARAAAITFDDGYACNARVAAPILRAQGLPATFFLTTGAIGDDREFWWDELARLVIETQAAGRAVVGVGARRFEIDFGAPLVPPAALKAWTWSAAPQHARLRHYMEIWTELRARPHAEQRAVLDAMWQACAGSSRARESHRAMTPDEARSLDDGGLFRIAAHTVTHPALGDLPEAQQLQEVADSRQACEALSTNAAPLFAYPYGDFTPMTARIVRQAGFELACSTQAQAVVAGCDMFAIPRLQVLDRPAAWLAQEAARLAQG